MKETKEQAYRFNQPMTVGELAKIYIKLLKKKSNENNNNSNTTSTNSDNL